MVLLIHILFHFLVLFAVPSLEEEIPLSKIYVFGDSNFQSGFKSSDQDSWMKAGYFPYGSSCQYIDDPRFTNGRTIPELVDRSLNLTHDPLLYALEANFASASAGILPESGTVFGKNLCFKEQIRVFKEYVQNNLKGRYPAKEDLSKHLLKSIYLINIGTSDYIHNYLQPNYYNTSNRYNGDQFADLLIEQYGNYLKDLHKLGARKMVIYQLGPLGCYPYIIEKLKPKGRCADNINDMVSKFNNKLDVKLTELKKELEGLQPITARMFSLIENMIKTPANYGFEETRWPCCPIEKNGTGLCKDYYRYRVVPQSEIDKETPAHSLENSWLWYNNYICKETPIPEDLKKIKKWTGPNDVRVCSYKRFYVFFDELHLTEDANRIIVEGCLDGTGSTCTPLGMKQLVEA